MSTVTTLGADLSLPPEEMVFGRSPALAALREKIEKLAPTGLPVLIHGESGAGKELLARAIHRRWIGAGGEFGRVDCTAFPDGGPAQSAPEAGRDGTLFFDEVGALSPAGQARLLQMLKEADARRNEGGARVRIICSSSRDLAKQIEAGAFRPELYFHINVLSLRMPPLRERREDVAALFAYFADLYCRRFNLAARPVSAQLMRSLVEYRWPGNLRELENLVKRYVVMGTEEAITGEFAHEAPTLAEVPPGGPVALKKLTRQVVRQLERQVILQSLNANNWNRKRVARALSISYRALLYKIRDAGLGPNRGLSVVPAATEAPAAEEKAA